eukprot:scaffold304414_cov32-Tisochrysis_lutea.AAC.1
MQSRIKKELVRDIEFVKNYLSDVDEPAPLHVSKNFLARQELLRERMRLEATLPDSPGISQLRPFIKHPAVMEELERLPETAER